MTFQAKHLDGLQALLEIWHHSRQCISSQSAMWVHVHFSLKAVKRMGARLSQSRTRSGKIADHHSAAELHRRDLLHKKEVLREGSFSAGDNSAA